MLNINLLLPVPTCLLTKHCKITTYLAYLKIMLINRSNNNHYSLTKSKYLKI